MRRFVVCGVLVTLLALGAGASGFRATGVEARSNAHSAGCGWKPVRTPAIKGGAAVLSAVVAPAPNDVWLAGSQGEPMHERTLVLHYDGRSLEIVPTPNPFPKSNQLRGLAAFGPHDVWAVGEGVTRTDPVYHYVPLVLRYDGRRWIRVSGPSVNTPFGAYLDGVAGAAADDLWSVGMARYGDDWAGLIEHWDGKQWRIVPSPTSTYHTVTAVSRSDVWAAGMANASFSPNLPVARWDGQSWELVADTAQKGWETYANASSASGPTNVWIVGQEAAGPFVERFDGSRFARVPIPYAHWKSNYDNEENSYLDGVAAISPRDVWAVGTFGIEHYDGRSWHLSSRDGYAAIAAASPTDIWAVGGARVLHYRCK